VGSVCDSAPDLGNLENPHVKRTHMVFDYDSDLWFAGKPPKPATSRLGADIYDRATAARIANRHRRASTVEATAEDYQRWLSRRGGSKMTAKRLRANRRKLRAINAKR